MCNTGSQTGRAATFQPNHPNELQDGTFSPSGLSSRSWEPSQPTPSPRNLGRSPLGVGHKSRGGCSSKQVSSAERQQQTATQRHHDGQSRVPERHSAHREGSLKGAQFASPKHRLGRRGRVMSSPRERSVAKRLQHSSSKSRRHSHHTSPGERASKQARLSRTPSQDHAASAQASPSTFHALLSSSDQKCITALPHGAALQWCIKTSWQFCIRLHHAKPLVKGQGDLQPPPCCGLVKAQVRTSAALA